MRKQSGLTLFIRRAAALLSSVVVLLPLAALAQRAPMTSHVPEEVATGVAPLVGHLTGKAPTTTSI
jgi:hypothetical protein